METGSLFGPWLLGNIQLILPLFCNVFLSILQIPGQFKLKISPGQSLTTCIYSNKAGGPLIATCSLVNFQQEKKTKTEKCEKLSLVAFSLSNVGLWWVNRLRSKSWPKRCRVTSGHSVLQKGRLPKNHGQLSSWISNCCTCPWYQIFWSTIGISSFSDM